MSNTVKFTAALLTLFLLTTSIAHATPARTKLPGVNAIPFGATIAAAKAKLGPAAKSDVTPSDPSIKILLATGSLYGETFSFNYTFAARGRFSEAYAIAHLPTGDHALCQTRWVGVMTELAKAWGKPDANLNRLSAAIPMQTITYAFNDGASIEAGLTGCLLTLNFFSPTAAR